MKQAPFDVSFLQNKLEELEAFARAKMYKQCKIVSGQIEEHVTKIALQRDQLSEELKNVSKHKN